MSTDLYCTNCNKEFQEYEEVTEVRGGCVEPFLLAYVISSNDGPNYQTLCKDCACDLQVKPQPNRVVLEVTGAVLSVRAERPEDVVLIVANPGGPMAFPRQTAFGGKHGRPIGKLNTVKEEA